MWDCLDEMAEEMGVEVQCSWESKRVRYACRSICRERGGARESVCVRERHVSTDLEGAREREGES